MTIGQPAPDFTLFSDDKKEVSLNQYEGKNLVLLFFPFAFTSTCTAELCEMRDNIATYQGLNALTPISSLLTPHPSHALVS